MDKEEMLKKHNYINKKTFFQKNEVLCEVIALIIVALGLFYLGTSIMFLGMTKKNDNKSTNQLQPSVMSATEEQTKSEEEKNDIQDDKELTTNKKENESTSSAPTMMRISVKNAVGEIVYSKEHEVGTEFLLNNVKPGTYFLSETTDKSLFATQTINNTIKCVVGNPVINTTCTVTEITPTQPTN